MARVTCVRNHRPGYKFIIPYEEPTGIPEKWCWRCRRFKPFSEFYKSRKSASGYASKCKACDNAYRAEKYRKKTKTT